MSAQHSHFNEAPPAAADATSDSVSILLVDEDEEFCFSTSRYMQQLGYRITTAANSMLALDTLDHATFDVLVIDCAMLPGTLSGAALGRMLRFRNPRSAIIFITSHPEIMEVEGELPGPFLVKPFDLLELHAVIGAMRAQSRKS